MAGDSIAVHGDCASPFAEVRDEFARNFSERDEIGGAVCVYHGGEKVVDLWGGHQDSDRARPWNEDTITMVYSIAKSMVALSVHMLVERGQIDLDRPVANYWPEFLEGGEEKRAILVRHILSHYCGLTWNIHGKEGDLLDYPAMIRALELQEPGWPPATLGAYNTINYGFLNGEVVRRVTGEMVQAFLKREVFDPLGGVDFHIGMSDADITRCADVNPPPAVNVQVAKGSAPAVRRRRRGLWCPSPTRPTSSTRLPSARRRSCRSAAMAMRAASRASMRRWPTAANSTTCA